MTKSTYSREIADIICDRMSNGESLRVICRDPGMPISEGGVRGWAVRNVDGFGDRYRAARLLLMEYWADEIVDIADDGELDPGDRQIRTSVRQWIMSKVSRHYGDKVQIGGDPDSPLQIILTRDAISDGAGTSVADPLSDHFRAPRSAKNGPSSFPFRGRRGRSARRPG